MQQRSPLAELHHANSIARAHQWEVAAEVNAANHTTITVRRAFTPYAEPRATVALEQLARILDGAGWTLRSTKKDPPFIIAELELRQEPSVPGAI